MSLRLVLSVPRPSSDALLWALWSLPLRLWLQNLIWLRGPQEQPPADPENVA